MADLCTPRPGAQHHFVEPRPRATHSAAGWGGQNSVLWLTFTDSYYDWLTRSTCVCASRNTVRITVSVHVFLETPFSCRLAVPCALWTSSCARSRAALLDCQAPTTSPPKARSQCARSNVAPHTFKSMTTVHPALERKGKPHTYLRTHPAPIVFDTIGRRSKQLLANI